MKPVPNVQLQALGALITTAAALVLLYDHLAVLLSILFTVALLAWSIPAWRYWRRRTRAAAPRSSYRRTNDQAMLGCFAYGICLPGLLTFGVWALNLPSADVVPHDQRPFAAVVAAAIVAVPLAMLVSSAWDWYFIRVFRDGCAGGVPACRRPDSDEQVFMYARWWVAHRFACEFVIYGAILIGIVALEGIALALTSGQTATTLWTGLGALGVVAWTYKEANGLYAAYHFFRRPNEARLGGWLAGLRPTGQRISGFALDVALTPGVQLIRRPRTRLARDISDEKRSIPLASRDTIELVAAPRPICQGHCEFWFAPCEVGLLETDDHPATEMVQHSQQS
jgi:hypothetical protein